jgi:predicted N-acetyltransferase YhbS
MSGYELRAIGPDEAEVFLRAGQHAFHEEPHAENLALWASFLEVDRTLAVYEGGTIVATSAVVSFPALTVPGGRVPLGGISAVGVHPLHRGRGLLGRMMRAALAAVHERGTEAITGLWASEGGIYGRYGYGMAGRLWDLTVRSPEAALHTPPPDERPRAGTPSELLDDIQAIHAAEAAQRVGMIERDRKDWEAEIADFEHERGGAGRLRALVWDGPDGPAGYALFAVRKVWTDHHRPTSSSCRSSSRSPPMPPAGCGTTCWAWRSPAASTGAWPPRTRCCRTCSPTRARSAARCATRCSCGSSMHRARCPSAATRVRWTWCSRWPTPTARGTPGAGG